MRKEQTEDMKRFRLFLLAAGALLCSCQGQQNSGNNNDTGIDSLDITAQDESMIQGLACDGCNDTIAIFLRQPYQGDDPDTLNILNASRQKKVYGRPHVGDKLALLPDPNDSTRATMMIVLNDLTSQWCYKVKPTLRLRADVEGHTEHQQLQHLPDSVRDMLNEELVYGFHLLTDNTITPIGWKEHAEINEKDSPIEYPAPPRYNAWHIAAGRLILQTLSTDSLQTAHVTLSDTTTLVTLNDSTLILRFPNGQRSYFKNKM